MVEVGPLIAAERRALADFLDTLAPEDWEVPSLCPAWRVRDVVAHIVHGPIEPPAGTVLALARGGFRVNHVVAESARRWGQQEPATLVRRLREIVDDQRSPLFVTRTHVLADLITHELDIRRPLLRPRPMPPEAFRITADLMVGVGGPLAVVFARSPRSTVDGLRLVAEDVDWSHGDGPEVRGSAEALLLAITARPVERGELTGPGASTLLTRISRGRRDRV
ncbi:uncharacterized protein (TIGR03083 family) [Pseudonocardia hierapolitana]|uniref:Uncharacterized protein (TIGR03083 family) n=1 Tax=Pseudonocardia hierapolitana TaxID=1128676 RepID=A0A561SSD7_9PSEU|nr:maleylpyruvate isomerase family mycothiol-dependent enzyme [Pseudonocardia hierapolitana]TWF77784.1 uncharacterized protein (TIGR03083 family) [Pseudonocardia hierapolitana]